MIKVLKFLRHSNYRPARKYPVRSQVKYAILQIQSPDHNVHEINLVSEEGTGRGVQDTRTEELIQVVRECV